MLNQRVSLVILFILGFVFVAVSLLARPFGLDVTDGYGIIQLTGLLIGITILTLATWLYLRGERPESAPNSLQADIGVRLAGTGLIFTYVAGYADLLRIGTHDESIGFDQPFVGPLQLVGLVVGIIIISAGLFMYRTSRGNREQSLFNFQK